MILAIHYLQIRFASPARAATNLTCRAAVRGVAWRAPLSQDGEYLIRLSIKTMQPFKLHTKTTLLASAITVAVLIAALLTISARVVDLVRDEQKALAEWQAISLAELISNLPPPHDQQDIVNAASLVRSSRPNVVGVRVWERAGGVFVGQIAAARSVAARERQ